MYALRDLHGFSGFINHVPHDEMHSWESFTLHNQQGIITLVDTYYDNLNGQIDYNTEDCFNRISFPMHEGFHFKIENFKRIPRTSYQATFEMDYVIYSESNNTPVFKYHTNSLYYYLCAHKLKKERFLFSAQRTYSETDKKLYLVENQILSELEANNLCNQCLRPMKKYKRWWERIQKIEQKAVENE